MKTQGACLLLLLSALAPAMGWNADEVDFPGDVQGWDLAVVNSTKYTGPDGSPEWFRYTCTATSDDTAYNFKMVTGNTWDNDYGGNTNFAKNTVDIMWYQPLGDTASLLAGGASNGFRYVFTAKNPGLTDTYISVMELSGDPAQVNSVSGGTGSFQTNEAVIVTAELAAAPPPEQKVYVRYTTNDWADWQMVPGVVSGSTVTVMLTNLAAATVYEWYLLTSTADSNYLAAASNGFMVDALTLSWDNNSGNNYHFGTPGEAAWLWHNDNRVIYGGSNAQLWVKIGYISGDATDPWVTNVVVYYVIGQTNTPAGSYGVPGNGATMVVTMRFDHVEQDSSDLGEAMWWVGELTNLPYFTVIKYKIGAWYATNYPEHFADYGTSGTNDATFSFQLGHLGDPELLVNGMNASYTTTKFFIDEAAGETQHLTVIYRPGVTNLQRVEIFTDLDRRDYVDVDYTNAYISGDGYPDGIKPPDGNLISTNDVGAYYRAYPMSETAPGEYVWTGTVSRCGAYRLTARHQTNGMAATNWIWYTDWPEGRRDHAIVVSPRKALSLTMYELNALTVEATAASEAGRSTFRDLLSTNDFGGDDDGYDYFNLDYLDFLQVNCLWFQPIHPNGNERMEDDPDTGSPYDPGSPYATRDYFAVAARFGADNTEEGALAEFTNFVAACDNHTGNVGTINVMLDGVFNHTSWDAEMGQGGVDLGYTSDPTNRIGAVRPSFYSLITDYGMPATYYVSAWSNDFATAPDRGDFGKWDDVTELYYGKYAALVRHNPEDNGNYLNEGDWYDYSDMTTNQMDLWRYFAYYVEYWLEKTGHPGSNTYTSADDRGIDGLRCDFAQGLPPQAWEYIINHTRKIKWNFIFMAETLDGGIPGYRSNRHFDILNENLVFQFTQSHINDSWDIYNALESRRSIYNGGLILLNLTSHDEVLPDDDPWLVASRYGALAAVEGVPMIFYGQEKGIKNYNSDYPTYDGFVYHELNFGKWIPHFKKWNQLTVWTSPPPDSAGLDVWYGRVNFARQYSPALRSPNRYFLKNMSGADNARIFAVAKYENAYGSPRTSDVVLAFALLLRHGESHTGASDTYNLQPVWDLLGLDTGKLYNVCNLAASDAFAYVWPTNRTGQDLYDNGIWVNLPADTAGPITNDGALVQYLKVQEINQSPQIDLPGPHILPVGATTSFPVTVSDPDGDAPILTNTVAPAGATFSGGVFTWTAGPADCGTTNPVEFVADDQRGETNSVVTNSTSILVPFDSDSDSMSDGWEWSNFGSLTNGADDDYDGDGSDNITEYIAGTDPTSAASYFHIMAVTNVAGETNQFTVTVSTEPDKHYTILYTDTLSNDVVWAGFANTNLGVGTWLETSTVASAYTFVDDFTTNTSGSAPATGRRFYRVKVRNP